MTIICRVSRGDARSFWPRLIDPKRARQVVETVAARSEVAVLTDGERGKRNESPYFTGRVVGNRDLGYLAHGPCVLVAAEGLHAVPWGGSFP